MDGSFKVYAGGDGNEEKLPTVRHTHTHTHTHTQNECNGTYAGGGDRAMCSQGIERLLTLILFVNEQLKGGIA
jgi:hypothetical protein